MSSIDYLILSTTFELRFESLSHSGRAYAFPCDAAGNVDLDLLSETLRESYLFARGAVGFELRNPVVCRRILH